MSDPDRIAQYAGLNESPRSESLRTDVDRLTRDIEGCDRQLQRLLDAYQRGVIEVEDLVTRRKELDARRALLLTARKDAEAVARDKEVRGAIRGKLPDLVRSIRCSLDAADFATRQRLVRLLIDRIVIHENLDVEVHYALPISGRTGGGHRGNDPDLPSPLPASNPALSDNFGLHSESQFALADGFRGASSRA